MIMKVTKIRKQNVINKSWLRQAYLAQLYGDGKSDLAERVEVDTDCACCELHKDCPECIGANDCDRYSVLYEELHDIGLIRIGSTQYKKMQRLKSAYITQEILGW